MKWLAKGHNNETNIERGGHDISLKILTKLSLKPHGKVTCSNQFDMSLSKIYFVIVDDPNASIVQTVKNESRTLVNKYYNVSITRWANDVVVMSIQVATTLCAQRHDI